MNRPELVALQRKVDEARAGFPVDIDPWLIIDELLDEIELMRAICGYHGLDHPHTADVPLAPRRAG